MNRRRFLSLGMGIVGAAGIGVIANPGEPKAWADDALTEDGAASDPGPSQRLGQSRLRLSVIRDGRVSAGSDAAPRAELFRFAATGQHCIRVR